MGGNLIWIDEPESPVGVYFSVISAKQTISRAFHCLASQVSNRDNKCNMWDLGVFLLHSRLES